MNWTNHHQVAALSQGWGLFENSDHGLRIERFDDARRFACDAAAQAFVALRALEGDPLARTAWRSLASTYSVWEI